MDVKQEELVIFKNSFMFSVPMEIKIKDIFPTIVGKFLFDRFAWPLGKITMYQSFISVILSGQTFCLLSNLEFLVGSLLRLLDFSF